MNTITNTNHNILTLTEHVAKSINSAAGKIDKKVYGDSIRMVPTPPLAPKKTVIDNLEFIGGGLLCMFMIVFWLFNFQNKCDRVKERFFR